MRVQIASDLHLEFDAPAPKLVLDRTNADVLILAGDIDVRNESFSWLKDQVLPYYEHVIYIPGNHEYYGGVFQLVNQFWAVEAPDYLPSNFHFLYNKVLIVDGVKFIGATLWTDFGGNNIDAMKTVERGLNDYRLIKRYYTSRRLGRLQKKNIDAQFILEQHNYSREFIERELSKDEDLTKVVITHHAPSISSVHPRFMNQGLMNFGYFSRLDHLVERSNWWFHGHTHDSFDYQIGQGRVVCNPRGYRTENSNFDLGLTVDV